MPVSFTVEGGGGGRRWPTYVPSVVNSTVQLECSLVLKAPWTPASDSREGWRGQEKVPHLVRVPARLLILVEQMFLSKLPGVAIQH